MLSLYRRGSTVCGRMLVYHPPRSVPRRPVPTKRAAIDASTHNDQAPDSITSPHLTTSSATPSPPLLPSLTSSHLYKNTARPARFLSQRDICNSFRNGVPSWSVMFLESCHRSLTDIQGANQSMPGGGGPPGDGKDKKDQKVGYEPFVTFVRLPSNFRR